MYFVEYNYSMTYNINICKKVGDIKIHYIVIITYIRRKREC